MEKARQFLCIYDKSNDYNERLLSLYNGLYLLLKDELWSKVQGIGMERERLEDALAYVREDEEKSGKTLLPTVNLKLIIKVPFGETLFENTSFIDFGLIVSFVFEI